MQQKIYFLTALFLVHTYLDELLVLSLYNISLCFWLFSLPWSPHYLVLMWSLTHACLWLMFSYYIIFHPFSSNLPIFLYLKWVTCRQHILQSCFLIYFADLCVLIGVLRSFAFNVVLEKLGVMSAMLLFLFSICSLCFSYLRLCFSSCLLINFLNTFLIPFWFIYTVFNESLLIALAVVKAIYNLWV